MDFSISHGLSAEFEFFCKLNSLSQFASFAYALTCLIFLGASSKFFFGAHLAMHLFTFFFLSVWKEPKDLTISSLIEVFDYFFVLLNYSLNKYGCIKIFKLKGFIIFLRIVWHKSSYGGSAHKILIRSQISSHTER